MKKNYKILILFRFINRKPADRIEILTDRDSPPHTHTQAHIYNPSLLIDTKIEEEEEEEFVSAATVRKREHLFITHSKQNKKHFSLSL